MLKRYDLLAKRFVNIGKVYPTDNDIIQLLQERTRKISDKAGAE